MHLMTLILKSFQKEITDFVLKKCIFCSRQSYLSRNSFFVKKHCQVLLNAYLPLHHALWPTVVFLGDRSDHF